MTLVHARNEKNHKTTPPRVFTAVCIASTYTYNIILDTFWIQNVSCTYSKRSVLERIGQRVFVYYIGTWRLARSSGKRGRLPRERSSPHRSMSEGLLSISFRRRCRSPSRSPRVHPNNKQANVQLTRTHAITIVRASSRLINFMCMCVRNFPKKYVGRYLFAVIVIRRAHLTLFTRRKYKYNNTGRPPHWFIYYYIRYTIYYYECRLWHLSIFLLN